MIRIGTIALFSELAGLAFSGELKGLFAFWRIPSGLAGVFFALLAGRFRWLLLVFAAAFAFSSFCLSRCPSRPLTASDGSHPFRALRFARRDRLFRQTLICRMLMGVANLMMLPMRVECVANPQAGLALSVGEIAF